MRARASCILLIMLVFTIAMGIVFAHNASGQSATPEQAFDDIGLSMARDFLYASQPQSPTEDSVLVTAQLYKDGKPLKKAGIPVSFSLGDGRFATLDESRVYTDEWGTASTQVRSYNSGLSLPERPFRLAITASAEGRSAQVTLPITGYMSLRGKVTDKAGGPVERATVSLAYNKTRMPVKASGSTTTTDVNGTYQLNRVPTDLGDIVVYVKKDSLETSMPANSSSVMRMR